MTWTAFSVNSSTGNRMLSPHLFSDGAMWCTSGRVGMHRFNSTSGFLTGSNIGMSNSGDTISDIVSDGTNVYQAVETIYPLVGFGKVVIATLVGSHVLFGGTPQYTSPRAPVINGSKAVVFMNGWNSSVTWSFADFTLSTLANGSNSGYGVTLGAGKPMYPAINDGTWLWMVEDHSTSIVRMNPSTYAYTTYTLPTTVVNTVSGYQIGFDGTNIYIAAAGGGIIVWNVTTNTGSTYGSTQVYNVYYSPGRNMIYADAGLQSSRTLPSGNVYTMPVGGGAISLDSNILSAMSDSGWNPGGFGDGPNGELWYTGYYNYEWAIVNKPSSPNQIVRLLV